jgi:hypothetical protein
MTKTIPIKKELPKGWFCFAKKGMRDAVLKAVNDSNLPPGAKQALVEEIQSLPADHNFIAVDAHRHLQGGKSVSHSSVTGSAVLVS